MGRRTSIGYSSGPRVSEEKSAPPRQEARKICSRSSRGHSHVEQQDGGSFSSVSSELQEQTLAASFLICMAFWHGGGIVSQNSYRRRRR